MNVEIGGEREIALKITGAVTYTAMLGPNTAALRAELREFASGGDGYRGKIGPVSATISGGAVELAGGATAITFPVAAAPLLMVTIARFAAVESELVPPPYSPKYFVGKPVCPRCARFLHYVYTGPFDDRWYKCAVCPIKYCGYDGKFDIVGDLH